MKFRFDHAFEAPIERVLAMYTDAAYIPAKYAVMGLREVSVVRRDQDEAHLDVTHRFLEQASITIPAMARKLIGDSDWFYVAQTERWHFASLTGELIVDIEPFKQFTSIRCDMKLLATASGCVNQMHWDVTCSVPLLGGTLAKFLADDIQRKTQRDGDVARQLLASHY